jgi:hypothetical protein
MSQKQTWWSADEVERRLAAEEPLSKSDRVQVDQCNMSVMAYLQCKKWPTIRAIQDEYKVSLDEAVQMFRNGPVGRVLYGKDN